MDDEATELVNALLLALRESHWVDPNNSPEMHRKLVRITAKHLDKICFGKEGP